MEAKGPQVNDVEALTDRFRFQQVANEVASQVSFGTLRELRYQLRILQERGHGIDVAVDCFDQAADIKAKNR